MLFLLIGVLLIASVLVLCVKKSRETLYLSGMCMSLMVQFTGLLIFIAKKGGFSRDIIQFLYFSLELKNTVQYLFITLDTMGYLIAVGRYLFPLFLMEMALHCSMATVVRRYPRIKQWALVLPSLSLVVYWPSVFRWIVTIAPGVQYWIVQISYLWVLGYVALALALLVHELFSITIRFYKRQFALVVVCMAALSGLYLLYCGQDPGQVYRFYSYDYVWNKGIGYLQYAPTMTGYILLVVVNVICGVLGFTSLMRYTQDSFVTDRDDMVMERKFDVARTGASVFVHSIKNQLLANRVLEKHICQELDSPEPDLAKIRAYVNQMHESNELLISRSEELYRTVKSKSMRLTPVSLREIKDTTMERFGTKYPGSRVRIRFDEDVQVLADRSYLSEALYNLLTNAWEANLEANHGDRPVELVSHLERLYTVIEVRDRGNGIPHSQLKKVFEPFYSSKNSNYSWGMGLYHVRTIIKAHLGSVRVESTAGQGTSFFVLLPAYGATGRRRWKRLKSRKGAAYDTSADCG